MWRRHGGTPSAPPSTGRRSVRMYYEIFTDTLPRNTAGKLLKRELRATYAATP
ncbi:MAG: hypothetical protein JWM87_4337 [Candidatus Eremiobacteraeota bacterium]|nr:hypothetical protein [Candidatus Eremiobacteraeota bacterium]